MLDDTPNGVDLDFDIDGDAEMEWDRFLMEYCEERQAKHPHECVCGYHDVGENIKSIEPSADDKAEIDRRLQARREAP